MEADSYLIPREQRTGLPTQGDDYYQRGFDFDRLLKNLSNQKQTLATNQEKTSHSGIIIVEGVFLLKTAFTPIWDASIWLEISDEEILKRGSTRDAGYFGSIEKAKEIYETRIIPAQALHRTLDLPTKSATNVY